MIRQKWPFLLLIALLFACAGKDASSSRAMGYSIDLFTPMTFLIHQSDAPLGSYLAINVFNPSAEELRAKVEENQQTKLKTRDESHITVIRPTEYDQILKEHLSISRLNELALQYHLQQISFEPICVGRGQVMLQDHLEQTYFVVMKAPEILNFRQKVKEAFVANGGDPKAFQAEDIEPHLTLGFSSRDLHAEDGIVKTEKSCLLPLRPL